MEEFTRVDIYDTKGMEYLFVIGYLLILIVFWNIARNPQIIHQIRDKIRTLSASILRIPQGIFFSRNHTWAHLSESGEAKVGLDDFIQHVTGSVEFTSLKDPGEHISKGEVLTVIDQNGKNLKVFSPVSGKIIRTNSKINSNPEIVNNDPYSNGWIYKIKPDNWLADTKSYLLAEEATDWSTKELVRFKDFLAEGPMRKFSAEPSMVMLQDGGEIRENVLSELPGEVWEDFQKQFLNYSSTV